MEHRDQRMQRQFQMEAKTMEPEGVEQPELWAEGYAVCFDSPTVLFEVDGVEYREQIAQGAFDQCAMGDVIFNYNHGGKVLSRTRNGTLQLEVDQQGLKVRARLDGTEEGRRLYEEIQGGYIDRMSFQFTIEEEAYDRAQRMWTVQRAKRLYDVSAVDIPAYEDTSIEARRIAILEEAQEKRRQAELARHRVELKLML